MLDGFYVLNPTSKGEVSKRSGSVLSEAKLKVCEAVKESVPSIYAMQKCLL